MQSAKSKCNLTEQENGFFDDSLEKDAYIWYEENWQHDDYEHLHQRAQLTFVKEGYQYFHINDKIYLVPQNHVIWVPSLQKHKITSEAETVKLMVSLFKNIPEDYFYSQIHVFPAPPVLKEMILYAKKWNKETAENNEQEAFMNALLISLPHFCDENNALQIPLPSDKRLLEVCQFINQNYQHNHSIEELAEIANLSSRSLQRIFKQETGISVKKYVQLIKILKSIELIDCNQFTLSEIAYKVGYKSLSAFTSSYQAIMNTKPKISKKNIF